MASRMRKQPQQERSRQMVDRIVEAARRVLLDQGYARTTTNRVAAEAGISPGSLYQYFPDKQAILDAVIEAHSADVAERLAAVATGAFQLPPRELVAAAVGGLIDVLDENREYVRLMTRELPRARIGSYLEQMERRIGDVVATYLAVARPADRVEPHVSAWLLVRMIEHLCVDYVLERPDFPREQLVAEIVRMTSAHLQ